MIYNNLLKPEDFKRTNKKRYTIHWKAVKAGVEVYNKLEDCSYVTDVEHCIVMKGTCGEYWVLTPEKLLKTYEVNESFNTLHKLMTHIALGKANIWHTAVPKTSETVWALKVPVGMKIEIRTAWGSVLHANRDGIEHYSGDYVVCANDETVPGGAPNLNDMWVVNGGVFRNTYNMRYFRK